MVVSYQEYFKHYLTNNCLILRKIKNDGFNKIAVEKIPNKGLGKTINDRLKRASKYQ